MSITAASRTRALDTLRPIQHWRTSWNDAGSLTYLLPWELGFSSHGSLSEENTWTEECQIVFIPDVVGNRFNWHPKIWSTKQKQKSTRVGSVSAMQYCTSELTTHQSRQNDTTAQTQNRKVSAQLSSKKMAGNRISECQNTAWVIEPYAT